MVGRSGATVCGTASAGPTARFLGQIAGEWKSQLSAPIRTELLRLRLAAKTLLEWRTPSSAVEYVSVLDALLGEHPVSRLRGISAWHIPAELDNGDYVIRY